MHEPFGLLSFALIQAVTIEPKPITIIVFNAKIIARLAIMAAQFCAEDFLPPFRANAFWPLGGNHLMQHPPPTKAKGRAFWYFGNNLNRLWRA